MVAKCCNDPRTDTTLSTFEQRAVAVKAALGNLLACTGVQELHLRIASVDAVRCTPSWLTLVHMEGKTRSDAFGAWPPLSYIVPRAVSTTKFHS
jgi:hypothetical protein